MCDCRNFIVTKDIELQLFQKCRDYFTLKIISSCPGKSFFLLTHFLCILSQDTMRKTFFFTAYGMRVTALYFVSDLETPLRPLRAWCGTYWRLTLWSPSFLMFQIILCDLNNTTQQKVKRKSGVTEPRKRECKTDWMTGDVVARDKLSLTSGCFGPIEWNSSCKCPNIRRNKF